MKKETLQSIKMMFMRVAVIAAAFVWWSVLYPELCFPGDTYEIVYDEDAGIEKDAEGAELLSEEELYAGLLQAGEEQVIVKSRLLEWIKKQMK